MSTSLNVRSLVLEIGTEEIPSRFIPPILSALTTIAADELRQLRIPFKETQVFATPRRVALFVYGVSEKQDDLVATFKGPSLLSAYDNQGNATRAAAGFAKSRGVSVESLKEIDENGTKYVAAEVREDGKAVAELLPTVLPLIISRLAFPKNMYWDDPAVRFARPIRWLVALFGSDVVPFTYGGVTSGRVSSGHRFMGNRHVEIPSADRFMEKLYDNSVILDQEKRRQNLLAGIANLEHEVSGVVELDPELVDENLYLVEYPVPFYGSFDERFLEIPQEVLITSMKKNQKYFAVRSKEGKLKNTFVGVANNRAVDMRVIREGNERVLRSRLSDAAFFWAEDRKHPLAANIERLKTIVYQEKLGTVYDKVIATQKLALWLCGALSKHDLSQIVERAALLSKADLVSHMVYEFPEVQGVMGREYASLDGENPRVTLALYEQYLPRSSSDATPTDDVGAILGLAERIHIIVNCHKVGLEPTGSQDPYALRRAARCINEIIWARKFDVDLGATVNASASASEVDAEVVKKIMLFIEQRLLMQLKEKGFEHDLARLAISVSKDRPLQALRLMEALNEVKDEAWFAELTNAAVRVRNILQKSSAETGGVFDIAIATKTAEKTLFDTIEKTKPLVDGAIARNDWKSLTATLAELSPAIAAFFKDVMVMDKDERVRANRLALLSQAGALIEKVGDLGSLS
ncbi:glycine--tRNA ligase beta subunit [Synergistales bacterium]|nr:glycine--tRNA ligase beta subunit [Synergistales bacterium]